MGRHGARRRSSLPRRPGPAGCGLRRQPPCADLLHGPPVAVGVGEVHEADVVEIVVIRPRHERSSPPGPSPGPPGSQTAAPVTFIGRPPHQDTIGHRWRTAPRLPGSQGSTCTASGTPPQASSPPAATSSPSDAPSGTPRRRPPCRPARTFGRAPRTARRPPRRRCSPDPLARRSTGAPLQTADLHVQAGSPGAAELPRRRRPARRRPRPPLGPGHGPSARSPRRAGPRMPPLFSYLRNRYVPPRDAAGPPRLAQVVVVAARPRRAPGAVPGPQK